jgi:soluble lytic murein transglycosylase-like protein
VAKRESLSPELLHVVIAHESAFRPCAVSRKGAMGMMQLMPATAADLGVANPFDPEENIDGGARYLGYLKQRFGGDLRLALAAYNAGPRRVDNYRGVPPIPETVGYVSSILRHLRLSPPQPAESKPAGKI